jgi:hypothetical protein
MAQERSALSPTIVVYPFTLAGAPRDTADLRASGERAVLHLNGLLRADTTVRWLEYRPLRRPRDPETGAIVAARYGVIGSVHAGGGDSVWIAYQLVSVETLDLLLRDSAAATRGEEEGWASQIAWRIVGTLHQDLWRARTAATQPPDSAPPDAATLVSRALLYAGRGDTATAVALLRQAASRAPQWAVPCSTLQRLRPAEPCP